MDQEADIAGTETGDIGDFLIGEITLKFEPEHFSLIHGEAAKGLQHESGFVGIRRVAVRPGFRISLSEFAGIDRHARGATLSYREQQVDGSGAQTDRRSTVVFEKQASGALLWRHLHETFC